MDFFDQVLFDERQAVFLFSDSELCGRACVKQEQRQGGDYE
jgi:hypothetical protein